MNTFLLLIETWVAIYMINFEIENFFNFSIKLLNIICLDQSKRHTYFVRKNCRI